MLCILSGAETGIDSVLGIGSEDRTYRPGEILIKYRPSASHARRAELARSARAVKKTGISRLNIELLGLPPDLGVEEAVAFFSINGDVEYAEPNYLRRAEALPDDPEMLKLWGLQNTGQTVNGITGTPDADIDAPEAWDLTTGSAGVVIAVIDSGIAWEHPDLGGNIWTNTGEIPGNGIDDDANGFVDDVRGWDFVSNDNDPTASDPASHGSHVAGTIAAIGDNASGVTGVMWQARLMPLRFLDTSGSGFVADEIAAIDYAITNGAKLINASYGSTQFSQAERDAIAAADAAGILFVAAAGNDGTNTDINPHYPSSYVLPNIISVAATTPFDLLAFFSNFGNTSVDIGAPGTHTYSTLAARETVFSDDFESGFGLWTTGGTNDSWGLTGTASASPTQSLADSPGGNYLNNTDSFARNTAALDLSGKSGCRLDYRLRRNTERGVDYLRAEESGDGLVWTLLNRYSGDTGGFFQGEFEDLKDLDGDPSAYFRFRLLTDNTRTSDGVYLDDVDLNCSTSSYAGTEFGFLQGTSMATPHVTGAAGLVASMDPSLTNADIRSAVVNSAEPKNALAGKASSGGRLNAFRAVLYTTGADLMLKSQDLPNPVFPGGNLSYKHTVTNRGLLAAADVELTDTLPAGVQFVSAVPSQGACAGMTPVVCSLGGLPKGSSAVVTIVVTPPSAGNLFNAASVSGSVSDPVPENNSSIISTLVATAPPPQTVADLAVTLLDDPDPVTVGSPLVYTMTVLNEGPDTATQVVLTNSLPSDITLESVTPDQGSCSGTLTVNCDLGSLHPGSAATVIIEVTPVRAGTLSHSTSVTSDQLDPDSTNDSADEETTAINPVAVSDGGDGGGCFIAAAYDSAEAPQLKVLRAFRDRVLLPNRLGRVLTTGYYRLSPAMAEPIRGHLVLRVAIRVFVQFVVLILEHPIGSLGTALGLRIILFLGLGSGPFRPGRRHIAVRLRRRDRRLYNLITPG